MVDIKYMLMDRYKDIDNLIFLSLCGMLFFIPVATSPAVIMGGLAIALWVFSGKFIKDHKKWLNQKWTLPVMMFMLLPWIGLLWTNDVSTGLIFAKKTHYWLYAFAIASISISAYRVDAMMKSFMAGVSFTSMLFLLQLLKIVPMRYDFRGDYSVGLLNRWAHISFSLLITFCILLLSFYFRKAEKKNTKVLCLILMLISFLALSFLFSDSGHLAFILLSPVVAYNLLKHKNILKVSALSILMVGALFLSPVTQGRFNDTIIGTLTYKDSNSLTPVQGRFYMWTGALKIYSGSPVFGIGTGGYRSAMKDLKDINLLPDKGVQGDQVQPHNSFLYMAVSFGIPGLAVLIWLFVSLLKNSWQRRNELLGFSTAAFTLVLIIGGLTDTQIIQVHFGLLWSIFTGLSGTSYERV